ncbi:hypothetical protein [Luteolibacter marinus]|uniref:hypothetical protein n=1 Tax=Luteolibacter marinus TaxID=2776705 RepID=UPI003CCD5793
MRHTPLMNGAVLKGSSISLLAAAFALATRVEQSPESTGSDPPDSSHQSAPALLSPDAGSIPDHSPKSPRPTKMRGRLPDRSLASKYAGAPRVIVGGQVHRPGNVVAKNLREAIERGGGATEFGSMKRVRLTRGSELREFDLTQSAKTISLQAHDVIEVPQKRFFGY